MRNDILKAQAQSIKQVLHSKYWSVCYKNRNLARLGFNMDRKFINQIYTVTFLLHFSLDFNFSICYSVFEGSIY